jgi:hypothetical protein
MIPITIAGFLYMASTNGDGPQLLTETAEFVSALAQIGVALAVEITLRPIDSQPAPPAVAHVVAPVQTPVQTTPRSSAADAPDTIYVSPAEARVLAAAFATPAPEPQHAPLDPTPAASAPPNAPQRQPAWSDLSKPQRANVVDALGLHLTQSLGHPPSMAEWNARKPQDWPGAKSIGTTYAPDTLWRTLQARWGEAALSAT